MKCEINNNKKICFLTNDEIYDIENEKMCKCVFNNYECDNGDMLYNAVEDWVVEIFKQCVINKTEAYSKLSLAEQSKINLFIVYLKNNTVKHMVEYLKINVGVIDIDKLNDMFIECSKKYNI